MPKMFLRCLGKTACQENDEQCRTCGRSLDEIYATRELVDELVSFAQKMQYQNSDTFFEYVAAKAVKKINFLQQQQQQLDNIVSEKHEYY